MQRSQQLSRAFKAVIAGTLMRKPEYWARAMRRRAMPVLCYHRVCDEPDPLGLAVSPPEFTQQMRLLANSSHVRPVSATEFARIWNGQSAYGTRVPVLVSFDDGFRDNLTVVAPALRRHGVPAILFVTTDVLAGMAPWYDLIERLVSSGREDALRAALARMDLAPPNSAAPRGASAWVSLLMGLPGARFETAIAAVRALGEPQHIDGRYLSETDLKDWHAQGFEVGAHTCTHARLSSLDARQARWEMSESKARLEALLGYPVSLFAYPFGGRDDFTSAHSRALAEIGFDMGFTTIQGGNRVTDDPFTVRRKCVQTGLFSRPGRAFSESLFMADLMGLGADLSQALHHALHPTPRAGAASGG